MKEFNKAFKLSLSSILLLDLIMIIYCFFFGFICGGGHEAFHTNSLVIFPIIFMLPIAGIVTLTLFLACVKLHITRKKSYINSYLIANIFSFSMVISALAVGCLISILHGKAPAYINSYSSLGIANILSALLFINILTALGGILGFLAYMLGKAFWIGLITTIVIIVSLFIADSLTTKIIIGFFSNFNENILLIFSALSCAVFNGLYFALWPFAKKMDL